MYPIKQWKYTKNDIYLKFNVRLYTHCPAAAIYGTRDINITLANTKPIVWQRIAYWLCVAFSIFCYGVPE